MANILILYHSKGGSTRKMAEAVGEGVDSEGVKKDIKRVTEISVDDLPNYDGVIIGSPNYFGTMAAEVKDFIDKSVKYFKKLEGKVGGAFTSTGMVGGGGETTLMDIIKVLLVHGFIVQGEPNGGHFGPVAIGAPDENVLKQCRMLGAKVAKLAKNLGK